MADTTTGLIGYAQLNAYFSPKVHGPITDYAN